MRIVDRHELMKLPDWTPYVWVDQYLNPIGSLTFKGTTLTADWVEISIFDHGKDDRSRSDNNDDLLSGKSVPMEDSSCRNGFFSDDDRYLVLESADVVILKKYVDEASKIQ